MPIYVFYKVIIPRVGISTEAVPVIFTGSIETRHGQITAWGAICSLLSFLISPTKFGEMIKTASQSLKSHILECFKSHLNKKLNTVGL